MKYRALGELQVSVIGLGCNNFGMRLDAEGTKQVVDAAIDAGINYFDTAESYGTGLSEEYLGQAIKGRRDQVLVASKWGHTVSLAEGERGGDPAQIRARLDASLARLGTDYIDHYQLHRPDPETPAAETLGCLSELRAEGKIREIGCTHFSAADLLDSHAAATAEGVAMYPSVQNYYSLLTRDPETNGVFDVCADLGIGFVPYFPLESGLLTGKYKDGIPHDSRGALKGYEWLQDRFTNEDEVTKVENLRPIADRFGCTLAQLALAWATKHPMVSSVVTGASRVSQVVQNFEALDVIPLITDEVDEEMRAIVRG